MAPVFTVRTGTAADAIILSALAKRTHVPLINAVHAPSAEDMDQYTANALSVETLRAELQDPTRLTLFVFPDDDLLNPCGYSMICDGVIRPGDEGDPHDHIQIKRVFVDAEFHGSGASYVLMDNVVRVTKERKRKVVWLDTAPKNVRAQRFYQKYGFEATGEHASSIGNSEFTDIVFTLQA